MNHRLQDRPSQRRKRRVLTLGAAAVAVLLLVPPAIAGDGHRGPSWEGFLERHDADDDGRVTQEELTATGARFAPVDQNGDGVISEADFVILRDGFLAAGLQRHADENADGELTAAEVSAWFMARDIDGNGQLDGEDRRAHKEATVDERREGRRGEPRHGMRGERGRHHGDMHGSGRMLHALDSDDDGALELADLQALFARVDADGDGVLGADELPQREHRGRHGHPRGPDGNS